MIMLAKFEKEKKNSSSKGCSDSNCINGTVPGKGYVGKGENEKEKKEGKGEKKEGKKGRGGLRGEKKRERERGGRIEFDANR